MKIIVPMAGRGSRLRPHTLTVPKPLVPIAGKPIVRRLVEDITRVCGQKVDEIAFVIGDFGAVVEAELLEIAKSLNAKGVIYHQDEALGTAHAILCAKEALEGPVVVAFADTLFRADFTLDTEKDGIIWVQKVEDPRAYGVIKMNENNVITDFVEKPQEFVSDLAIIGIYFFKDGLKLSAELQYLIDNNIKEKGEFQLTNALENMKQKGAEFYPGKVDEWLDCGNKDATVFTCERVLDHNKNTNLIDSSAQISDSNIIQPCFIESGVIIKNSTVGPNVSVGKNTIIVNTKITSTIVQANTEISNAILKNSMIGNYVLYNGPNIQQEVSVGDYCEIK